jgi:hypothetical protein
MISILAETAIEYVDFFDRSMAGSGYGKRISAKQNVTGLRV